jgi:hypothetical protein
MDKISDEQIKFAQEKYPYEYKEWLELSDYLTILEKEIMENPEDFEKVNEYHKMGLTLILLEIILQFNVPDSSSVEFKTLKNILKEPNSE